jgi:hypothetical protein
LQLLTEQRDGITNALKEVEQRITQASF